MSPKIGDKYESPSGLGFEVVDVDPNNVTVKVERVVRSRDGGRSVEVHTRVVPRDVFARFSRPYRKL